jgi:hypothetical protein
MKGRPAELLRETLSVCCLQDLCIARSCLAQQQIRLRTARPSLPPLTVAWVSGGIGTKTIRPCYGRAEIVNHD